MWRSVIALPERGRIGIFNRSYYEECLVTRVHPEILAKEKIPPSLVTKNIWRERFEDISAFERYLARNGTMILKFFLNVSKEEQRQRFLDRLEQPAKNWKFSMADITERALVEQIPGRISGHRQAHLDGAGAMVRGAGRPQMVRAGGDRFGDRQRAGGARTCNFRASTRPRCRNSKRCARRWRTKARAGGTRLRRRWPQGKWRINSGFPSDEDRTLPRHRKIDADGRAPSNMPVNPDRPLAKY